MALDCISSIGNAISGVTGLIKPWLEEKYAQQYDNEHRERLKRLDEIMAMPNGPDRAAKLAGLVGELCLDAGYPAGDISGTSIDIPVPHFRALITAVSDDIRQQHKLAKLTFKVG